MHPSIRQIHTLPMLSILITCQLEILRSQVVDNIPEIKVSSRNITETYITILYHSSCVPIPHYTESKIIPNVVIIFNTYCLLFRKE